MGGICGVPHPMGGALGCFQGPSLPCTPGSVCVQWGGLLCVCVAGMVTLGADAAVPVQQSTTFCVPLAEALAFSCFTELMKRMNQNFPHGGAMDTHFANMRSLIQVGRQHRGSSLSGQ